MKSILHLLAASSALLLVLSPAALAAPVEEVASADPTIDDAEATKTVGYQPNVAVSRTQPLCDRDKQAACLGSIDGSRPYCDAQGKFHNAGLEDTICATPVCKCI